MGSLGFVALSVAALAAFAAGSGPAQADSFQLKDLPRIVTLSDPQIAPDGRRIAVVLSRRNVNTNKNDRQIYLIDVASGSLRPLTRYRQGVMSPRWSPHGHRLAFIAKAPAMSRVRSADAASMRGAEREQLFVMPMRGGDALQVTHAPGGVLSFAWSPAGTRLAYIAKNGRPEARGVGAHDRVFRVSNNNFLVDRAAMDAQLWVVSSAGGVARQLTDGDFSLDTDHQYPQPQPEWSPDGRFVLYARFPGPYWGSSFESVLAAVPADGGSPADRVPLEGSVNMRYAPVGGALAFMRPRNGDQNNGTAVYVDADGKTFNVTRTLARNIDTYTWLPGGHSLLLTGEDGTRSLLWRQPLQGPARALHLGKVDIVSQASVAATGAIAFIGRTASHADEVYWMPASTAAPRRLTDVNGFLDALTLGRSKTIRWRGSDGFEEDGVLTYPPAADTRVQRYPLVLLIHGGPEMASTTAFSSLAQLLAAQGFLVFQPNYRGSTNLGDSYQHAIFRDTGEGPGRDVMAGLAALERLGIVDRSRIGVSGWSYGGYLTDWLTSHYPGVWRAAVAGAALNDWVLDNTISFYQQGDEFLFGGSPWSKPGSYAMWKDQSPLTYVRNVKAPTLIMGDVWDSDVPLVNSYLWYHALRDIGVKTEFYAYAARTHFPPDIDQQMDVYGRWVQWMRRYLK